MARDKHGSVEMGSSSYQVQTAGSSGRRVDQSNGTGVTCTTGTITVVVPYAVQASMVMTDWIFRHDRSVHGILFFFWKFSLLLLLLLSHSHTHTDT